MWPRADLGLSPRPQPPCWVWGLPHTGMHRSLSRASGWAPQTVSLDLLNTRPWRPPHGGPSTQCSNQRRRNKEETEMIKPHSWGYQGDRSVKFSADM